jgi:hypothetical protein
VVVDWRIVSGLPAAGTRRHPKHDSPLLRHPAGEDIGEDLLRGALGVLRRTTYASRISEAACDYSATWAAAWMMRDRVERVGAQRLRCPGGVAQALSAEMRVT